MSEAVAKQYADALFQLGKEKAALDEWDEQLRVVQQVFRDNQELMPFLTHPKVDNVKKKLMLRKSFDGFSREVKNILLLMVDRNRAELIPLVAKSFIDLVNEEKGVAEATVYTVRPLSAEELQELGVVFAKKLGKKVLKFENVIDPNVLGGVKLRVGNTVYDGSLSGKLERIRRNIIS